MINELVQRVETILNRSLYKSSFSFFHYANSRKEGVRVYYNMSLKQSLAPTTGSSC